MPTYYAKKKFLIANGYFYALYLINRQITKLKVVPDMY